MNLPNKLTVLRMLMIPLFVVMFYLPISNNFMWALVIFSLAAITDTLDGQIARKQNLVTDFGKFMDPLADKLLVMAALVVFVEVQIIPGWTVVIILARELTVTGLRTLAASAGVVMAADNWGKAKTVVQMVWTIYTLLSLWLMYNVLVGPGVAGTLQLGVKVGMALVLALTVISGGNYLWKNRQLFADR